MLCPCRRVRVAALAATRRVAAFSRVRSKPPAPGAFRERALTLRETAIAAALAAGAVQKRHFRTALAVDALAEHDVKLEVDRLSEQAIIGAIRRCWPEHCILAEESGELPGTSGYLWIIDPLDGTVNYSSGLPYYCTSVACYWRLGGRGDAFPRTAAVLGRPLVGVVYAAPMDELLVAEAGKGATCNGVPVRAQQVDDLAEAVAATGFGGWPGCHEVFAKACSTLAPRVRKMRCLGAGAYDLAHVGSGRIAAFHERGMRTWDLAAAHIIISEAGGVFEAVEYEDTYWDVIAAAPGVFGEFRDLVHPGRTGKPRRAPATKRGKRKCNPGRAADAPS